MNISVARVSTPLGPVWVAVGEKGLLAVHTHGEQDAFLADLQRRFPQAEILWDTPPARAAGRQVQEYLNGEREQFDLPIDWSVLTPFQRAVLRQTLAIPRGETRTYGEIAAAVGKPRAARAVGRAQATNPMPIVIPCHRVVARDGSLHGYGRFNGLETKAWLLWLEGALD